MDNVIFILDKIGQKVAEYQYDAWGKCKIIIDKEGIGTINPFRWKSLYYDKESGLYYINGRYYSPDIKQYISAMSPETVVANAGTIYGLNMYLLTIANPVNMIYNGHTIETNTDLIWEPDEISGWKYFWKYTWGSFWGTKWGKGVAIVLWVVVIAIAIFSPGFYPMFLSIHIDLVVTLYVGGIVSGFQSKKNGNGFMAG